MNFRICWTAVVIVFCDCWFHGGAVETGILNKVRMGMSWVVPGALKFSYSLVMGMFERSLF